MINILIAFIMIINTKAYDYPTGGFQVSKTDNSTDADNKTIFTLTKYTIQINNTQKTLTIPRDCKQVKVYDPNLNSKLDPQNPYFLMTLTCADMIRAADYFEAQQKGDYKSLTSESVQGDELIKYQCVMNVTFDNNEHCCCPERNYDLKSKMRLHL